MEGVTEEFALTACLHVRKACHGSGVMFLYHLTSQYMVCSVKSLAFENTMTPLYILEML